MKDRQGCMMMLKNEHGTSIVEFAIIAPLLFVILFGIIEFGILLYDKAVITNASREVARALIVFDSTNSPCNHPSIDPTIDPTKTILQNYQAHLISFGAGTISVNPIISRIINNSNDTTGCFPGDYVDVKLTYPFHFLVFSDVLKLLGGNISSTINLDAETVMRLE